MEDHHAAIESSELENSFVLRDFNSAYGTYVNDCLVQNAAVKVSPGDKFRFGPSGTIFELIVESTPQVMVTSVLSILQAIFVPPLPVQQILLNECNPVT